MGTSVAFIKYLSQYRVNDPRKGIQYGQVFVWWQALSGAIQVALVVAVASTWAPQSAYALVCLECDHSRFYPAPGFLPGDAPLSEWFPASGLRPLPGYGTQPGFPDACPAGICQPGVFLGEIQSPVRRGDGRFTGAGDRGVCCGVARIRAWLWLFRRVGYNPKVLFLAHFDWEIVKSSFQFGVFEMLGSLAWAVGQASEILITQARLINYAEIWGNWGLAQNFIFAFNVTQTLNDGTMPAISEAISHGKKILSQYYSVMLYKWNGLVSFFLGAVLLAVADRFILGASGPEFVRASRYVIPLAIWGAFQYPFLGGRQCPVGLQQALFEVHPGVQRTSRAGRAGAGSC